MMKNKMVVRSFLAVIVLAVMATYVQAEKNRASWKVWDGKLNINRASEAELVSLEGIGKITAHRVVEYRERIGGFKSLAQLKEVNGISQEKFSRLEDHLTLFEDSNLKVLTDVNSAPPSALQVLPKVSKKMAEAIIEFRERNDGFDNIEELLEVPGISRSKLDELMHFVTVQPFRKVARQAH